MDPKMSATDAAQFLGVTVQAIHNKLKSKNLLYSKSQNRVYFGHETAREIFQLPFLSKIVVCQMVKGGVGKTETCFSGGIRCNLYGARVLFVDLDQQGNITTALGAEERAQEVPVMVDLIQERLSIEDAIIQIKPGLDLVPSRIENSVLENAIMLNRCNLSNVYKDMFDPLRAKYDLILIDCPAAIGQSVSAAALCADEVIAPIVPEKYAFNGLKIIHKELARLENDYHKKINLRVVLNKYDARKTLSQTTLTGLLTHDVYSKGLFSSYIRVSQDFPNAIERGLTIFDTLKNTTAKEDIDLFSIEMMELNDLRQIDKVADEAAVNY